MIVLAGAFYIYQNLGLPLPKVESLESITPQEVIYYLYSYNPDKKIKDFQANALSKQIMDNALFKEFVQPRLDNIHKQIPFLSDFLERDVAVGVYSLAPTAQGPVPDILILVRIDPQKNIKLKKTLADYCLSMAGKAGITRQNYRGIKIVDYKLGDKDIVISSAFLSDVVLTGNNKALIRKSIDIYRNKSQKNLVNNNNFKKLAPRLKKDAVFWMFADQQNHYQEVLRTYSYDTLKSRSLEAGKSVQPLLKMKPFMDMMNIFEGAIYYVDYDQQKSGFLTKIYQTFNKAASDQDLLNVISYAQPIDKNITGLGLENTLVYYSGTQDLMNGWKLLRKFTSSMDEIMKAQVLSDPKYSQYKDQMNMMSFDSIIAGVESFLGINIETDIFPVVGSNFGVVFAGFKDADVELLIPGADNADRESAAKQKVTIMFPEIYVFAELKDNTKMQQTMDQITQRLVDNINQLTQPAQQPEAAKAEKEDAPVQAQGSEVQSQDVQPVEMQDKPAEPPKLLNITAEDYNGVTLKSIEISSPQGSFLKPTYCILDKHIIFSLSPDIAKKVIDMYTAKTNSFVNNQGFQAAKDKVLADYSNLLFFDFSRLIANIRSTKTFSDWTTKILPPASRGQDDLDSRYKTYGIPTESGKRRGQLSKEKLDSILDILSNIETFIFTNKVTEPGIIETDCYLKVKGL